MVPRVQFRMVAGGVLAAVLIVGALARPANTVWAAPSVTLSRYVVAAGDTFTVQGHGFAAQDSVVAAANLRVSGHFYRLQGSTVTDQAGSFQIALKVPAGTNQGAYIAFARDFHGHYAARALTVIPLAYIPAGGTVSSTYVVPMHSFYVSGAGFGAGETVRMSASFPQYDGNTVNASQTVTASSSGSFYETSMTVPGDAQARTVTLTARGLTSHRVGMNRLAVVYRPSLLQPQTARPGTSVQISGTEFVPASVVRVSLTIPRNGATTETLSRSVTTDGRGDFTTSVDLPSNVRIGKYALSAFDTVGQIRASATLLVSVRPTISVSPGTVFPGQAFTVSGDNFESGVRVTVIASFPVHGGGSHSVSKGVQSGGRGNYSVILAAPNNAAPGLASVVARTANAQTSTRLRVQARPTPTPRPTNAPTSTSTPIPTATPTSVPPKKQRFAFRSISIWYHTVRAGTFNHVDLRSTLKVTQGIWITVRFPSGAKYAVYANTSRSGQYHKTFDIPKNAVGNVAADALVTFKLWHGSGSRTTYRTFTVIR